MNRRVLAAFLAIYPALAGCAAAPENVSSAKATTSSVASPTAPISVADGWCNVPLAAQDLGTALQTAANMQSQGECPSGINISRPGVVRVGKPIKVRGLLRIRAIGGDIVLESTDANARCFFELSAGGALDLSGLRVAGSDDVQSVYATVCVDDKPIDRTRYSVYAE